MLNEEEAKKINEIFRKHQRMQEIKPLTDVGFTKEQAEALIEKIKDILAGPNRYL